MDVSQWPQELGLMKHNMEELSSNSTTNISTGPQQLIEKRARPQKEQALNCPRCNSTNTKFCYYNNYSLTQPRYFCKSCRRYWTEGGTLRNVPVGGGSRKNKKSSSSSLPSSSTSLPTTSTSLPIISSASTKIVNPKFQDGHDLNLGFPLVPEFNACTSGMSPFMSLMNSMPPIAFGVQDFRSNTLSFPLDGDININGVHNGNHDHEFEQENKSEESGGDHPNFWSGMIGGGGGGSW